MLPVNQLVTNMVSKLKKKSNNKRICFEEHWLFCRLVKIHPIHPEGRCICVFSNQRHGQLAKAASSIVPIKPGAANFVILTLLKLSLG